MNSIENGNEPAQPVLDLSISTHEDLVYYGLTKRESFAIRTLEGLLAGRTCVHDKETNPLFKKLAIQYADELLYELSKP